MIKGYFDGCCESAWQAGFIDGEGCLTIQKQLRQNRPSPSYRPSVTISNTNRGLLEPFRRRWGGGIYKTRESRNGWSDAYTWHCPHSQVVPFLTSTMPYLRGKKCQAELLLQFMNRRASLKRRSLGQGNGSAPLNSIELSVREKFWNKIRGLNTKGKFSRSLKGGGDDAAFRKRR